MLVLQFADERGNAVHALRVDAARTQRLEHVAPGVERHLSFRAGAAEQYRHAAEHGRIGRTRAHDAFPWKPLAARCWVAWPMSPAPIISHRSPSCRMSGNTVRSEERRVGKAEVIT